MNHLEYQFPTAFKNCPQHPHAHKEFPHAIPVSGSTLYVPPRLGEHAGMLKM